jgi:histone H3/H4
MIFCRMLVLVQEVRVVVTNEREVESSAMNIAFGGVEGVSGNLLADVLEDAHTVERVFLAWLNSETRTPGEVSSLTGLPRARVARIIREGDFHGRYIEATRRFRDAAKPYVAGRAAEIMDDVVHRLATIVEEGTNNEAVAASRVLVGMLDVDREAEVKQVNIDHRVLMVMADKMKQRELSTEDQKSILTATLQGNVDRADERRTARSR